MFLNECAAGFVEAHECLAADFTVCDGFVNVGISFLIAEVGEEGMAGVVGEEFSLFEGWQIVGELEPLDFRQRSFEGVFVNRENAVGFDDNLGGIFSLHLFGHNGDHAADDSGDPADFLLDEGMVRLWQMPED